MATALVTYMTGRLSFVRHILFPLVSQVVRLNHVSCKTIQHCRFAQGKPLVSPVSYLRWPRASLTLTPRVLACTPTCTHSQQHRSAPGLHLGVSFPLSTRVPPRPSVATAFPSCRRSRTLFRLFPMGPWVEKENGGRKE